MPKRQSGLTEREVRFALVVARTGNASRAFLAAGYAAKKTVEHTGAAACRLLKKPEVDRLVQDEQQRLRRRLEISAERVAIEMAALAFSNIVNCLDNDGHIMANPKKWHPLTAVAVKSYSEKVLHVDGESGETILERRIVMHDKWKALERMADVAGFGRPAAEREDERRGRGIRVVVRNPDGSVAEIAVDRRA